MSLGSDLVPFVSDSTASLVLATISSASWTRATDEPGDEDGAIQIRVVERFSPAGPEAGQVGAIRGRRYGDPVKRPDMGFNVWNILPLDPGDTLLLALRVLSPGEWHALAAQAAPDNSSVAADLRRAFELEAVQDALILPRRYEEALLSRHNLLVSYALDAIARRGRVSRNQAAEMMARVLAQADLTPNMKLQIVQVATRRPIYEDASGADRANSLVIGAVAQLLTAERDPDWMVIWAQALTTTVLPEFASDANKDREIRSALIQSVPEPARRDAPAALTTVAVAHPNDARFRELAERWSAAIR